MHIRIKDDTTQLDAHTVAGGGIELTLSSKEALPDEPGNCMLNVISLLMNWEEITSLRDFLNDAEASRE